MFKTPGAERFVYLTDGRKLFLPKGSGGPVYLVPDLETHMRLERRYTLSDKVVKFAIGLGIGAALLFQQWMLIPALVLLSYVMPGWIDRVAIESLPEVHDPEALLAARAGHDTPGAFGSLGGILIAVAAGAPAAYLAFRDGAMAGEVVAMFLAVLLMLVIRLNELNESRPEDHIPGGYFDYPNTPIEPK